MSLIYRPMKGEDVEAVYQNSSNAFAETPEDRARMENRTPEEVARRKESLRRILVTDPDGAWVAENDGRIVGVVLARRREGLWVLSLLTVDAEYRSRGIGKALLGHALSYAEGCRGSLLASSSHPAALRRYAMAGFTLLPALAATGTVRREKLPAKLAVRDGDESDLELAAEVDRYLRGAPHGPDLEFLLDTGCRLFVSERRNVRGYAVSRDGSPGIVAATTQETASELLWACLADAPDEEEITVPCLTGEQGWAVDVTLSAGLALGSWGALCKRGEVGPLTPYLPNGALL